jgi:hypothetical protein
MPDFEADVPEQVKNLFDDLGCGRRNVSAALFVEEHDIDVAEGIQLAPAVTAKRENGQRSRGSTPVPVRKVDGRREDVLQQQVKELDPEQTDFAAAAAILVAQPESMLLDF